MVLFYLSENQTKFHSDYFPDFLLRVQENCITRHTFFNTNYCVIKIQTFIRSCYPVMVFILLLDCRLFLLKMRLVTDVIPLEYSELQWKYYSLKHLSTIDANVSKYIFQKYFFTCALHNRCMVKFHKNDSRNWGT